MCPHRIVYSIFAVISFSVAADALCVNVPRVSLRSGPGPKYEETWRVGKYTPLKKKGESKNGWIPVADMDGKNHWVYGSSVTDEYECAAVKADFTVVRTVASETGALAPIRYVDRYWAAKKVRFEDDWMFLEDDFGNRYWIKESKLWRPVVYSQISF
ncbi:MAG: hypothetical protein A4S09_01545 [Proteobacteria bacterium SG_bin7]|nr:MAG: hypothetical protein A4S09_01545 [Proteobacteria bacterium SG_bin7]